MAAMRQALLIIGILVALSGALFTLQGLGAIQGSAMSNTTTWSLLGPVIAGAGVALAYINRPRSHDDDER